MASQMCSHAPLGYGKTRRTARRQELASIEPVTWPRNRLPLFLALAFGSQAFFLGQFIGKSEMIAAGTAVTLARRRLLPGVA